MTSKCHILRKKALAQFSNLPSLGYLRSTCIRFRGITYLVVLALIIMVAWVIFSTSPQTEKVKHNSDEEMLRKYEVLDDVISRRNNLQLSNWQSEKSKTTTLPLYFRTTVKLKHLKLDDGTHLLKLLAPTANPETKRTDTLPKIYSNSMQHLLNLRFQIPTSQPAKVDVVGQRPGEKYVESPPSYLASGIPRIIHQIWNNYSLPSQTVNWMKTWREKHTWPKWQYWFWTREDWEHLIKLRYPKYYENFHNIQKEIFRADIIKYFIMFEIGGVYADVDVLSLRPLDSALGSKQCILSEEPLEHSYLLYEKIDGLVGTAFMACRPKHPFFEKVTNYFQRFQMREGMKDPVKITGPFKLDTLYHHYLQVSSSPISDTELYLAKPDMFMPGFDRRRSQELEEKCSDTAKRKDDKMMETICRKLKRQMFLPMAPADAYCDHLWIHSWMQPGTMFTDIRSVLISDLHATQVDKQLTNLLQETKF
ncbi:uncharacterized protein LOC106151176 [Lingula anatina]|uniref:Uncharacterized protein LOC106151176 n=1 Tax=Lingula anatina TaxID=7574 RepID=A0A1S3H2N0_LINAN|nr:uncharacterized protein LOC106151176 [Lingula anatina]|eukprot:XP_013379736.1 uncharacterized protein LOC106151176 [Lingula anatina]